GQEASVPLSPARAADHVDTNATPRARPPLAPRPPALLDLRRMADVRRVFGQLTLIQLLGNLVGALLTWFYFRFVDFTAPQFQAQISRRVILFNVVSFAALVSSGGF